MAANDTDVCEMLHVSPGDDGMGEERPCTDTAVGRAESGLRVCRPCGEQQIKEGFAVRWDYRPLKRPRDRKDDRDTPEVALARARAYDGYHMARMPDAAIEDVLELLAEVDRLRMEGDRSRHDLADSREELERIRAELRVTEDKHKIACEDAVRCGDLAASRLKEIDRLRTSTPEAGSLSAAQTLQGLKNLGVDVECGACVEVFYTGETLAAHSCSKGN